MQRTKNKEAITNFMIQIKFSDPIPPRGHLTLATEENSYGFDQRKWFDGVVEVVNWDMHYMRLTVVDITEYQYMSPTCSKESFYECLANRFANLDVHDLEKYMKRHLYWDWRGETCSVANLKRLCLPFSLPSTIPICNSTEPGSFSFLAALLVRT